MPAKIIAVPDIPRTLSGKITELAVREVIHGRPVKNTDALANPQALEQLPRSRRSSKADVSRTHWPRGPDLAEPIASSCRSAAFAPTPRRKRAVEALDDLRQRLLKQHARVAVGREPAAVEARPQAQAGEAEKGLYLWGGVGRGKTWLMDLFFQSLPFEAKRRRHFHRFMHDVHDELKQLGESRVAARAVVADHIARETRACCVSTSSSSPTSRTR